MAVSEEVIRRALRAVKDPELNLSIVDLGLIYDVGVEDGKVTISMTLTSPGCPSGPEILSETEEVVRGLEGVNDVKVELVWEPFWTPERIDPRVRAYLGL